MASPRILRMGFVVTDADGSTANFQLFPTIDGDQTWIVSLSELLDFALYFRPLLSGRISQIIFSRAPDLGYPFTEPAQAGSSVENIGKLRFWSPTGIHPPMAINLPAPNKAKFPGKQLDMNDADVGQLLYYLNAGYGHATFSDPYGQGYSLPRDGYLTIHRNT